MDLARSLTKQKELQVDYNYLSYYHPQDQMLYMSRFWDPFPDQKKKLGLKSDLYIQALGFAQETDYLSILDYSRASESLSFSSFAKQLLAMVEELRLLEPCVRKRPGIEQAMLIRTQTYRNYYQEQLTRHIERQRWAEALLCVLYIRLTSDGAYSVLDIPFELDQICEPLTTELIQLYECDSTNEAARLCMKQWPRLEAFLKQDMHVQYFMLFTHQLQAASTDNIDDLTRKNQLKNEDSIEQTNAEESEAHEDKLPSWHRETSKPTESFLQFELESGTKIHLLGQGIREAEDGDQALGSVQASSRASTGSDFTEQELQQAERDVQEKDHTHGGKAYPYGKANQFAVVRYLSAQEPSIEDRQLYAQYTREVRPWVRTLQNTINKTLEHKQHAPFRGLHVGRLQRNLLPLWTDKQPRLFYKKQQQSNELDACFALLVDCSSSMLDKMDQTKKGIILFHEALAALKIKHSIHGFWEEASQSTDTYQPNVLFNALSFEQSCWPNSGPEILQLSPQEDNRDGYMIRLLTESLLKQSEKHRILLVFSDGEPAATGYDDQGIVDTYQAVLHARKQGITVIGVFLSTEDIQPQEQQAMKNIYGKQHLLINDVAKLPEHMAPLLKQLILKQIV
ncbi:nitric oxide reductase activation protein [Bacillus horti]|uniref:Nitric oxide reductase activation protein n=2 Tax=Caldalkalibacillus horti TaxID=77523 RepID=A0ABT9W2I0_9BACI|nr:nitric oxide reductase activation protein [Bacillus horti]